MVRDFAGAVDCEVGRNTSTKILYIHPFLPRICLPLIACFARFDFDGHGADSCLQIVKKNTFSIEQFLKIGKPANIRIANICNLLAAANAADPYDWMGG